MWIKDVISCVLTNCPVHTGDDIHYLDLSSDPDLFKGPKGDKQVIIVLGVLSYFSYSLALHE